MREQGIAQQLTSTPQAQAPNYAPNYAPRVGNQKYVHPGGERAQLVLGNQPPLPGQAVVRYVQPEEVAHDGALVPVSYYEREGGEDRSNYESSSPGHYEAPTMTPEGIFNMDMNTLWFIANGGARQMGQPGQRPYKSGPNPATTPPGPCYNCGEDHWIRDCPHPRRDTPHGQAAAPPPPRLPPLTRFCVDCGIKHFV